MSFKRKLISAAASAVAVAAFGTFVAAQDTTTQPSDSMQKQEMRGGKRGFGRGGMRGGKHGGDKMGFRGFSQLNLTDAQKEQIRTIHENARTAAQPQHEEARALKMKKRDGIITADEETRLKELRTQQKTSMEQTHNAVLAVLTAEQRTQLEQMKEEMKKRREERRQNRLNRQKQTTTPTMEVN